MIKKRIDKTRRAARRSRYAITRIEKKPHRTFAWIVSVQRRKQIWRRNFSDQSYGGKAKALAAAKAFRDQILSQHPPMSQRRVLSNQAPKQQVRPSRRMPLHLPRSARPASSPTRLLAGILDARARQGQADQVSIDRFGERGALKRAMRARKEALAALDGQWVNSEGLRHWLRAHCNASGSQREASRISGKR